MFNFSLNAALAINDEMELMGLQKMTNGLAAYEPIRFAILCKAT
jgi:hypothetical protein